MNRTTQIELQLLSSAFGNNENIPSRYTCDGENINPPLEIRNIPAGTKSLALIVDDPDAPSGTFDHWLLWNIPVQSNIEENSIPGIVGMNTYGKTNYGGPCPPSGIHRYFFKLYALSEYLSLNSGSDKEDLLNAMNNLIIAQTELIGLYKR